MPAATTVSPGWRVRLDGSTVSAEGGATYPYVRVRLQDAFDAGTTHVTLATPEGSAGPVTLLGAWTSTQGTRILGLEADGTIESSPTTAERGGVAEPVDPAVVTLYPRDGVSLSTLVRTLGELREAGASEIRLDLVLAPRLTDTTTMQHCPGVHSRVKGRVTVIGTGVSVDGKAVDPHVVKDDGNGVAYLRCIERASFRPARNSHGVAVPYGRYFVLLNTTPP
jgi:hypothetical protein